MSGVASPTETRLLLLLARGSLSADAVQQITALLSREIDWAWVLRQVKANGIGPLVTRNLRALEFVGVPGRVRSELDTAYRQNAVRGALMRDALVRLLSGLGRAGIQAVPLKGPALAQSVYGDTSLRACSDLDVLVPRDVVAPAFQLLVADGYRPADRCPVQPSDVDFLVQSAMEYGFASPAGTFSYLLELHWDIAWRWRADTAMLDDLWASARPHKYWGTDAWALSPEWELLFLAVHAARHRWQGLKWLVDIHELCTRAKLDWDALTDTARGYGLERVLSLGLSACESLFETPLPPEYAGRPVPPWLMLFPASAAPLGEWRDALEIRRLFPRPQERLRYLARIALRPTLGELALVRLPAALRPLYYPLRLLRLVGASTGAVKLLGARSMHTHTVA